MTAFEFVAILQADLAAGDIDFTVRESDMSLHHPYRLARGRNSVEVAQGRNGLLLRFMHSDRELFSEELAVKHPFVGRALALVSGHLMS